MLIHGRDASRARALIDEIGRSGHTAPIFYQADLSSLAGTRQLANAVLADHRRLDVFVSNAGIGSRGLRPERRLHLVAGDDVAGKSGLFFNGMREARANPQAYDEGAPTSAQAEPATHRLDGITRPVQILPLSACEGGARPAGAATQGRPALPSARAG